MSHHLYKKRMYSDLTVNKVRDDLYNVLRMPYMRFSKRQYNTISLATYVINFLMVIVVRGYFKPQG